MTKLDKINESMRILQEAGILVPAILHVKIDDLNLADNGTVEVWVCKKCRYRYKAPIPTLSVECPNGHYCKIIWNKTESTLRE